MNKLQSQALLSPPATARQAPEPTPPRSHLVDSQALLKGSKEVLIRHGRQTYRLYCTRNNKLILQK